MTDEILVDESEWIPQYVNKLKILNKGLALKNNTYKKYESVARLKRKSINELRKLEYYKEYV